MSESEMFRLAISTIIILLIIVIFLYRENSIHNKLLNGVWVADNSFVAESNSDSFVMIIDSENPEANMAITVSTSGKTIENSIGSVSISQHLSSYLSDVKEYTVSGYDEGFLPSEFNMKLDIYAGVLVIERDEKIYAVLVKENNI
jgi:hypothetical protein